MLEVDRKAEVVEIEFTGFSDIEYSQNGDCLVKCHAHQGFKSTKSLPAFLRLLRSRRAPDRSYSYMTISLARPSADPYSLRAATLSNSVSTHASSQPFVLPIANNLRNSAVASPLLRKSGATPTSSTNRSVCLSGCR